MKKAFQIFGLFFSVIMVVGILAGCSSAPRAQLKVYNWGDYIDESVIDEFEKKYNIDVIYDTFTTNE